MLVSWAYCTWHIFSSSLHESATNECVILLHGTTLVGFIIIDSKNNWQLVSQFDKCPNQCLRV